MIKFILAILFTINAFGAVGDTINSNTIFTGAKVFKNYVKNPNCNDNVLNLTVSTLTVGKNSSDTGQAVCSWNPGANSATLDILVNNRDSDAVSNAQVGKNCKASMDYEASGAAGGYSAYLTIGGTQVSPTVDLKAQNSLPGYWEAIYPCPTSATSAVKIHVVTDASGTIPRFKWWHASYSRYDAAVDLVNTQEKDYGTITIGAVTTAPTKGTTTIDKVTGHREGQFWVGTYRFTETSNGTAGSGDYIFGIPASVGIVDTTYIPVFTGALNTAGSTASVIGHGAQQDTGSVPSTLTPILYSASQFRTRQDALFSSSNFKSSGIGPLSIQQSFTINVKVPIVGWAPQTAQTPDQTNFGWIDGGPITITGTSANPTKGTVTKDHAWYKRDGENMVVRLEYAQSTSGTAGTGDYLLLVPGGQSINSSLVNFNSTIGTNSAAPPVNIIGTAGAGVTSVVAGTGYVSAYDATHVRLMLSASTSSSFQSQGAAWHSLNQANFGFSATYTVPIQGWYENQKAATLSGSVISSSAGVEDHERVSFGGTTEPSVCNSSPCTMYRNTPGVTSVTRTSAGLYVLHFATGTFSAAPVCVSQSTGFSLSGWTQRATGTVPTATTYTIQTIVNSVVGDSGAVDVICMGPH